MNTADQINEGKPDHNVIPAKLPDWFPAEAMHYLIHTETGASIRAIARQADCHASTISRQIRKLENRRDDPLVDEALTYWGQYLAKDQTPIEKDPCAMTAPIRHLHPESYDQKLAREARRILRRLCESGSVLAVAKDMEKAVVVRELPGGKSMRTAVVDREIAQSMAIKDWISCTTQEAETARIARYKITATGRSALKKLLADTENQRAGFSEAKAVFAMPLCEGGEIDRTENPHFSAQAIQNNTGETPLSTLARRKNKDGTPFLDERLVAVGEQLREDFELAHVGLKQAPNWAQFISCENTIGEKPDSLSQKGSNAARNRVADALKVLGPGLGDVVLRCCCYLEGLEKAEHRMGWSARSGKIVLRIALERLKRHYDEKYGPYGPLIG